MNHLTEKFTRSVLHDYLEVCLSPHRSSGDPREMIRTNRLALARAKALKTRSSDFERSESSKKVKQFFIGDPSDPPVAPHLSLLTMEKEEEEEDEKTSSQHSGARGFLDSYESERRPLARTDNAYSPNHFYVEEEEKTEMDEMSFMNSSHYETPRSSAQSDKRLSRRNFENQPRVASPLRFFETGLFFSFFFCVKYFIETLIFPFFFFF